jgi:hypothetical protein
LSDCQLEICHDDIGSRVIPGRTVREIVDCPCWPAPIPISSRIWVVDDYAAHKRADVRDRLAANPRISVHFTPTPASWLNLVEVWFCITERQANHRGTFGSVRDPTTGGSGPVSA